ncbi:sugar kinase, partial [Alicyclobacillaceae bacterium I2511]
VLGQYVLEVLKEEGVDVSQVTLDSVHPTGFQLKSKVAVGDPVVQYFRKNSAASILRDAEQYEPYFASARHFHLTGIPLALSDSVQKFAEDAVSIVSQRHGTISFDPNLRPQLWGSQSEMVEVVNRYAVRATYVFPGIQEGRVLTGQDNPADIADFYLEKGVRLVVVKLGATGAYYRTATEEGTVKGFHVEDVVDTVGAGDGFAVGVLSGLLEGLSLRESTTRGNAIGAMAVTAPGDMEGLPTRTKLDAFLMKA